MEKSNGGGEDIIKCFYSSLIDSMISSSIDTRLIQFVEVNNLELMKKKALIYQKEESWINAYIG